MIDNLILGDNAFFGIGHRSEAEAREKMSRFQDPANIVTLFKVAKEHGAGGVMLSAHENVDAIIREMVKDADLRDHFSLYPNIPYVMKYVREVTRHGTVGTFLRIMGSQSRLDSFRQLAKGGLGLLKKDFYEWARIGIDLELSKYRGTRIRAIFLHNGIVDLWLGLGMKEPFLFFDEYIRGKYSAIPGYGTLNLSRLAGWLSTCGLEHSLIMAPFNVSGFHMNPSQESSENAVRSGSFTLLAMNVLVSGGIGPEEALRYIGRFPTIRHVVIGASSKAHIAESFRYARENLGIR